MNVGEFRDKGITMIKEAVELDEKEDYKSAIKRYEAGVEQLIFYIKCEWGGRPWGGLGDGWLQTSRTQSK
jgi:hypothetical protein